MQINDRVVSAVRMLVGLGLLSLILVPLAAATPKPFARASSGTRAVVINEVAWMGTTTSYTAEWLELHNPGPQAVEMTGWTLSDGGDVSIALQGTIPAQGYYLLERTQDETVPDVTRDQLYTGSLSNAGETLVLRDETLGLIDEVSCSSGWFSGHADGRVPMVRVDPSVSGSEADNWTYNPRCGSATNSLGETRVCTLTTTPVLHDLAYKVYFNERATTATATTTEKTTLEQALLRHLDGADRTIDIALYGLNRQSVVAGLIAAHQRGVAVRVVGDDEAAVEGAYAASYQALQTAGIPLITDTSSYIQHNKFVVIDEQTVWTGSANLTATDLTLNANNGIVLTSTRLAGTYTTEFEEMWSGQFHADKTDNTAHRWDYRGTLVESFFSPTDLVAFEVWRALADLDETLHVAMFFWTDELLTDRVVERLQAGAEVYGVWGALGAANPYSADETLRDAGAELRIEDFAGEIHHKFAIIDVHGSDPTVILGSYNWTESGAYANDENTLIIHSAPLAAAYYDEWQRLWNALAGTVYLPLVMRQTPSSPTPTPTLTPRLTDTPGPTATATPVPPSATPTFTPTPTETPEPVNIHITYIEYNPPGDDVQGEYVRIENQGEAPQTMTNWTLRDIANHVFTFPAFSLGAGATVQVWTKSGADTATDLYWGSGAAIWNNTGDTAYLSDESGTRVDTYTYSP